MKYSNYQWYMAQRKAEQGPLQPVPQPARPLSKIVVVNRPPTPELVYGPLSDSDLARLSSAAYVRDFEQRNAKAPRGFRVDEQLSGGDHSVFYDPVSKRSVVAFRGTQVNDFNDISADLSILAGNRGHKSFTEAHDVVRRANEKYGAKNVTLTGHSLGGTKALHAQPLFDNRTVVFNPGASPFGESVAKKDNVRIVRNRDDTISFGYANSANETKTTEPAGRMMQLVFPAWSRIITERQAHGLEQFF